MILAIPSHVTPYEYFFGETPSISVKPVENSKFTFPHLGSHMKGEGGQVHTASGPGWHWPVVSEAGTGSGGAGPTP